MEVVKKILFLVMLIMFSVMGVWRQTSAYSDSALEGVFEVSRKPVLSLTSFMRGEFQEECRQYTEDLPGLRGTMVKIRNQFDYSLFSIPHATKIISGKQGDLFGEENILAYMGRDFPGEHYLDVKIRELKLFQDELWNSKKILLILLLTPDKASLYPELIPDRFDMNKKTVNNYEYYSLEAVKAGINVIDFNNWFIRAKDTSRYPLFARTGMHWSSYGALIAADSMVRYLRRKLDIKLPQLVIDSIKVSRFAEGEDDDIRRTMNLFWKIPQRGLAYPKFHFIFGEETVMPSALFIGDSYYWNWYRQGIISSVFSDPEFWYYDKEVYPESFGQERHTWEADLKSTMEKYKIIVLLHNNNGQGYDFGYGFADRVWPDFDPSGNNRIREIEAFLTKSEENMKFYENKSKEWGAPLETVIRLDAIFAGNNLLRQKK